MADHFDHVLEQIASSVNGFVAGSIVDLDSGMPLATRAATDFDLDVAGAYTSEMVKAQLHTMRMLGLSGLQDMLLTLESQLHLVKLVGAGTAFIFVAADRSATNLALLRTAVNQATATLA